MDVPVWGYFALLVAVCLIPLVYIVGSAIFYYPPGDHQVLQDAGVAELLGLNASDVVFSGYSAGVLFELITFLILK
jgi:hypothetical protein